MSHYDKCYNTAAQEKIMTGSGSVEFRKEVVTDFREEIKELANSAKAGTHFTSIPEAGLEYEFDSSLLTEKDEKMWRRRGELTIEEFDKYRKQLENEKDDGIDRAGGDQVELERVRSIYSSRKMFLSYLAKLVTLNNN